MTSIPSSQWQIIENNQPWYSPLSCYGAIKISGDDSSTFLQGQLSCDVLKLKSDDWQWGSYCTYQGKVISVFILFREENDYFLVMPSNLLTTTYKLLNKYGVFSKVSIENIEKIECGVIAHQKSEAKRIIPLSTHSNLLLDPQHTPQHIVDENFAKLTLIQNGIPQLSEATCEQFTPHMLNLPELGAVSFDKGCYTGL